MAPPWRANAVVWMNDPARGRVVAGGYGFGWWEHKRVFIAPFAEFAPSPVNAYKRYTNWDMVRSYEPGEAALSSILVFIRTGLWPAQGKFA